MKSRLASQGKLHEVIQEESKEACTTKNVHGLTKSMNAVSVDQLNKQINLDPDTILSLFEDADGADEADNNA